MLQRYEALYRTKTGTIVPVGETTREHVRSLIHRKIAGEIFLGSPMISGLRIELFRAYRGLHVDLYSHV